ncbi:MAG: hypothetical protein MMC33_007016 [Icmadophila ericetorum]|nr:hypothetical protein [Icmadophila ericetorum]
MPITFSWFSTLIWNQCFGTTPYPTSSFTGKTIIVTGSSNGLGLEAAKHFVRLNASKVILAVRNVEKGAQVKSEIESSFNKSNIIEVWKLDLSSYASVKAFAKQAQSLERLDALVENAGINSTKFEILEDDESTITTNVVSTFLLALLLLPKLQETATKFNTVTHLPIVTSEMHFVPDFVERSAPQIFSALNDPKVANMSDRYPVSKLLEVLYGRELAARISAKSPGGKPSVILNLVNPGFCWSGLVKDPPLAMTVVQYIIARTTEQGSRTLVSGACAASESHGEYMSESRVQPPSPFVLSEEGQKTQKRVWEELNAKLEKIEPGITSNI